MTIARAEIIIVTDPIAAHEIIINAIPKPPRILDEHEGDLLIIDSTLLPYRLIDQLIDEGIAYSARGWKIYPYQYHPQAQGWCGDPRIHTAYATQYPAACLLAITHHRSQETTQWTALP